MEALAKTLFFSQHSNNRIKMEMLKSGEQKFPNGCLDCLGLDVSGDINACIEDWMMAPLLNAAIEYGA